MYAHKPQLNLFLANSFLKEKFGEHLFGDTPNSPGVYRFFDKNGDIIYVGKSKNLRKRLFYYRGIRAGSCSRKEARLLSEISSWEITCFETEKEAILEENRLIRKHRPVYNHANKMVETYYFIHLRVYPSKLVFCLSMNENGRFRQKNRSHGFFQSGAKKKHPEKPTDEFCFGCFKGHLTVRKSFGALLQLLWMRFAYANSVYSLPKCLTRNLAPSLFTMPYKSDTLSVSDNVSEMIIDWYSGQSDSLLCHFDELSNRSKHSFTKIFIQDRIEILKSFYQKTLVKHRQMRDRFCETDSKIINQDEVDDFFVKLHF